MTLKEILAKHLGNDYPRRNFLYPQLQTDLEKLMKEIYINGLSDGHERTKTFTRLWQENKERFINHDS